MEQEIKNFASDLDKKHECIKNNNETILKMFQCVCSGNVLIRTDLRNKNGIMTFYGQCNECGTKWKHTLKISEILRMPKEKHQGVEKVTTEYTK